MRKSSLTQASGSMSCMYEKSEQHQNHITVNTTLDSQSPHSDSLFAESHNEQQQWDIKPEPYLPLKQEITPSKYICNISLSNN